MKKLVSVFLFAGALSLGLVVRAADKPATATAPSTVIHVITVDFKSGTKPEQIQAAIDGVHKLPTRFKGVTRVWTRPIKNQSGKSHIFVMEFASEQALKDYAGSEAQTEWYKTYLDIREESATSDITN
jgi:hypothetical protein